MHSLRRHLLFGVLSGLLVIPATSVQAVSGEDRGAAAIRQELLEMATPLRLMCVAAHPDDEDGATLAYYNRGFGVQTSILLANWGEGGQNEIGPELYEDLGVIRSKETLEAAKVVGTDNVYCLNQKDFGFSKTIEETWNFWNRDEALERAVRILRIERPHVVITNHRVGEGHGNHQAVAELIAEAVVAAGSESAFPFQIAEEGLRPWGGVRLFQRRRHHEGDLFEPYDVAVPVGELEPIRGYTYQEIASEALNRHRSQGIKGVWGYVNLLRSESSQTYFSLVSGPKPDGPFSDLFAEMEAAWWTRKGGTPFGEGISDVGQSDSVADELANALAACGFNPRNAVPHLVSAGKALGDLNQALDSDPKWSRNPPESVRAGRADWTQDEVRSYQEAVIDRFESIGVMQRRLERLIAACQGLDLVLRVKERAPVPGETVLVEAEVRNRGNQPAVVQDLSAFAPEGWNARIVDASPGVIEPLRSKDFDIRLTVPEDATPTLPESEELYRAASPWTPNVKISALLKTGETLGVVDGEARVEVAPDWEVVVRPQHRVVNILSDLSTRFVVRLKANGPEGGTGTLVVTLPDGSTMTREASVPAGETRDETFEWVASSSLVEGSAEFAAIWTSGGEDYAGESEVALASINIAKNLLVGVVQSYDRTLPEALTTMGIDHQLLTEDDLTSADLSRYAALLVDIRGYLERDDLRENNRRVLEYVEKGGRLVVFYHKSFDWNDADPPYAPFPLELSRDRVTEEDAPVTILDATHPILNFPNRIGPADWEGWIHERGLYFPGPYDPAYRELVGMGDAGSAPLKSGILIAAFGQGTYIYTPLSWYRQLQAGVPGAYRLFVNLVTPFSESSGSSG